MWFEFLRSFGKAFPVLFWVVDPLVAVPLFLAMTQSESVAKKRKIAFRAAIATWITLSLFALIGPWILKTWFQITTGMLRLAGGIILLLTAIDMVRALPSPTRFSKEEQQEGSLKEDISIVPLAIPMLAGPAAMSMVSVLMGQALNQQTPVQTALGVLAAIFLTALSCWAILRWVAKAEHVLSKTTIRVFERIMGLFLVAMAIGFILGGLRAENILSSPTPGPVTP